MTARPFTNRILTRKHRLSTKVSFFFESMAPNKRSTSPTNYPPWLTELLQSLQNLQQDYLRQSSSIREIRSIALENQHLLRSRLRTSLATLTQPACSASSSAQASINPTPNTANRVSNNQANNDIRNAAFPMPRVSRPSQGAVPRICWYHRQFGQASTSCMQPCSFQAPTAPSAVATISVSKDQRKVILRPTDPIPTRQRTSPDPVVTNRITVQRSFSTTESVEMASSSSSNHLPENAPPPSTNDQQPTIITPPNPTTDWNTDQELEYNGLSESSSSSESDSDNSQIPKRK